MDCDTKERGEETGRYKTKPCLSGGGQDQEWNVVEEKLSPLDFWAEARGSNAGTFGLQHGRMDGWMDGWMDGLDWACASFTRPPPLPCPLSARGRARDGDPSRVTWRPMPTASIRPAGGGGLVPMSRLVWRAVQSSPVQPGGQSVSELGLQLEGDAGPCLNWAVWCSVSSTSTTMDGLGSILGVG